MDQGEVSASWVAGSAARGGSAAAEDERIGKGTKLKTVETYFNIVFVLCNFKAHIHPKIIKKSLKKLAIFVDRY